PFADVAGSDVTGYEIHTGRTDVQDAARPFIVVARQGSPVREFDGAIDVTGNVVGTYLHGLFANDALRRAFLVHLATRKSEPPDGRWGVAEAAIDRYDRLADIVGGAIDLSAVAKLVRLESRHAEGRSE